MFPMKYVHRDYVFSIQYNMYKTQALYENLRLIILNGGREKMEDFVSGLNCAQYFL